MSVKACASVEVIGVVLAVIIVAVSLLALASHRAAAQPLEPLRYLDREHALDLL